MTESKPGTPGGWSDPDDAPEWTEDMFERAEYAVAGRAVRPATGVLTRDGVRANAAQTVVSRSYLSARLNVAAGGTLMADKKTGKKAASAASDVLKDGRTGKDSKTAAGSALSQREGKSGKGGKKK